jgi:uncharacterized membrane protein YkoI
MSNLKYSTLFAITTLAFCSASFAAVDSKNDAVSIGTAKIPLTHAITVAEHHLKGKAVRAELEDSSQGLVYDVEIVSSGKAFDVKVNPDSGQVMSSVEDRSDDDDATDAKE